MKSFPRQSRSSCGGIATIYKYILGSNITFKTNFEFTHTSFELVQASITLQHNSLHIFYLYRPPPNRRNNPTDSMFTEQLPDIHDYMNNLPGLVFIVGDMSIHIDNPLQSIIRMDVAPSRPDHLPTPSSAKTSELPLLVKSPFWWRSGRCRQCYSDVLLQCAGDIEADHTDSGIAMDSAVRNREAPHLGDL